MGNENTNSGDTDWERLLADEGMPAEIDRPREEPRGDSLEVASPDVARERNAQARVEESAERIWDS